MKISEVLNMATMSATIPVTKTASNIAKKWFSRRSLIPIKDHWTKNDKRDYKEDFNNGYLISSTKGDTEPKKPVNVCNS